MTVGNYLNVIIVISRLLIAIIIDGRENALFNSEIRFLLRQALCNHLTFYIYK